MNELLMWLDDTCVGDQWVDHNVTEYLRHAVARIAANGIYVDRAALLDLDERYEEMIRKMEMRFWDRAGQRVDYRSEACLRSFIYGALEIPLPPGSRIRPGEVSLQALNELRSLHRSIPPLITLLRAIKTKERFLCGWGQTGGFLSHVQADSRIRTTCTVNGTSTGRLTSKGPSLHNIPRHGPVRSIFRGEGENVLIECDYSQLELRIAALLSNDAELRAALAEGADIHRLVAAYLFGCDEDDVTAWERGVAKELNFGALYGVGPHRLVEKLDIDVDEAQKYLAEWKALFPGVHQWKRKNESRATKRGYVDSELGRRRHLPALLDGGANTAGLLRQANNFPIQATGADLFSLSTIQLVLYPSPELEATGAKAVMTLHDAIYFECPRESALEAAGIIQGTMESIPKQLLGPAWHLPVDVKVGEYWGDDSLSTPMPGPIEETDTS